MERRHWRITTRHPNGYRDGEHEVTTTRNANGTWYVSGGGFGCSRDYPVNDAILAIKALLAENGMTLVRCITL